MSETVTVTIERLAGLGDGQGMHAGRKLFVPLTLEGDVAQVRMLRRTKDADYASLERIITPSPARVEPVCRHYGECGGCTLQHVENGRYATFKQDMARAALRKAGFDEGLMCPLLRFAPPSRRRVDLAVKAGRVGYFAARSHDVVNISECKVLEPELEALVLELSPVVASLPGLHAAQLNGVDGGYDLFLEGRETVQWPEQTFPQLLRVSHRQGDKVTLLRQYGPVTVTFGGVKMTPPPGAFLQAVRGAQDAITALVLGGVKGAANVLDLFCGLGTYSLPLLAQASVTAVEGDAAMVNALQQARLTGLTPLRRDLFTRPFSASELARFDAVVINPPRAGAQAQCEQLAGAKMPIMMVSCNPATFARDARTLREGGYRLQKVTPIDQFTYSSHLEIIAQFSK